MDRLERKVAAMEDLYGRANPKPKPPTYDAEDMLRMKAAEEADALRIRERDAATVAASIAWKDSTGGGGGGGGGGNHLLAAAAAASSAWSEINVPKDLGADHGTYKWRQNQTYVEIFVLLPPNRAPGARDVHVDIASDHLRVVVLGEHVTGLCGELYAHVKAEASTWVVVDGVLEITLLKRNRRGNYENGSSNADTFWFSVLRGGGDEGGGGGGGAVAAAQSCRRLALEHPPKAYYDCEWTADPEGDATAAVAKGRGKRAAISSRR